jgi:hypothetical protein
VAADRPEEDKFGKQQAWGQNTYKLLSGTGAAPLLSVDNISRGDMDRNRAEAAEPHK